MKKNQTNIPVRAILLSLLTVGLIFLSFRIIDKQKQYDQQKEDLIELSNIQYGLFNIDVWRNKLVDLFSKRIDEFELTNQDRKELKDKISSFLSDEIKNFEKRYKDSNPFFLNLAADLFGVFNELQKQLPEIVNGVMEFIDQPENKNQLKNYIIERIDEYTIDTYSDVNYSVQNKLFEKYQIFELDELKLQLKENTETFKKELNTYKYLIFIISILFISLLLLPLNSPISNLEFVIFTLICMVLLFIGIYMPMMEIDARISEFNFVLFGETISFTDQVIFHNSRSIFGVIKILLKERGIDVLLVGILIFCFSVLFPISKLISSILILFSSRLKQNKFINILVYKTGKWSMADVMVVAIFMSYIGFSGIVNSQLQEIENMSQKIEVLTTNNSNLQIGFFSFALFVPLSLLLVMKIRR